MHLTIIFVDEDHTSKCLDNGLIEHRHREKDERAVHEREEIRM